MIAVILVVLVVALVVLLAFLAFAFQEWFLYMPQIPNKWRVDDPPRNIRSDCRSPRAWRVKYEVLPVETDDNVKIFGWLLKTRGSGNDSPTIIFCHGNAGNMGYRLPFAVNVVRELDCNVCLFDYRGYGYSRANKITEAGLKLDLKGVVEYIQEKHITLGINGDKLILMGRSLGGAVAVNTLAKYPKLGDSFAGVIIENSFLSVRDVAMDSMANMLGEAKAPGFMVAVLDLMLRMRWNSKEAITRLDLPILFMSAERDKIVPQRQMRALHMLFQQYSDAYSHFESFPRGGHNGLPGQPDYFKKLDRFVKKVIQSRLEGTELKTEFPLIPKSFS